MTITLSPDLEGIVIQKAQEQGTTPEAVVLGAIREKLAPAASFEIFEPRDEWERRLARVGSDCGISLSNEALSSEGLYD